MAARFLPSSARLLSRCRPAASRLTPAASLLPRTRTLQKRLPSITVTATSFTHFRRSYVSEAPSAFPQLSSSSPSTPSSSSDEPAATKIDVSGTAKQNPDGSTSYSASFQLPEQKREYELTFTCKVCSTRSTHKISQQGYHKGTVLVQCPGCKNRHLIADHLKIFVDKSTTIEDILREKGETIKKGIKMHDGDVEILPPDEDGVEESGDESEGTKQ